MPEKTLKTVSHGYLGKDILVERDPDLDKNHFVLCQEWLESERGWGSRPDGYSLHRIRTDLLMRNADVESFVRDYWESMPDETPDEYSRPCGEYYVCEIDGETYCKLKESKNGLRFFRGKLPEKI